MVTIAAFGLCLLLGALSVFQLLLAFGAPFGRFAWGGQHRVLPLATRLGSITSIVIYAVVAVVVTTRAELTSFNASDPVIEIATWIVAGYFFLGILMNLASRSTPERIVMTPLCAVMGVLCAIVALA